MSQFSPEELIRLVKISEVEAAMIYACDHNGNCYYPTRVGHRHAGLKGRDAFGETVSGLRSAGILALAYYTVIYHNDCARRFPTTSVTDPLGKTRNGRYRHCCPNNPQAVQFFQEQLREILHYDLDGIFIDMTFWPAVCLCSACREKYGRELPERIDWSSPEWVSFQRFREHSLAEFADSLTRCVHACRPGLPVCHQFSPIIHGWLLGQTAAVADASDYASGDFYGDFHHQRLTAKVLDAFTRHPPFEYMTSRCVTLRDHTSDKSDAELSVSVLTTLANGGASLLIDAIDPDGRLHEGFYRRLANLNQRLAPFRRAVAKGPFHLEAAVGLLFSPEALVDRRLDRLPLNQYKDGSADNMAGRENAVLDELLGIAELLTRMHIPWRIIHPDGDLAGLQAVVAIHATFLSDAQCDRIRAFVTAGGTLLATGDTSLRDMEGQSDGNFRLADLLGVDFAAQYSGEVTYLGPENVLARGVVPLVRPRQQTQVRYFLTFPDFPVQDPEHYASIHSDPPGKVTEYPGMTVHRYGAGQCVWLASAPFRLRQHTQREFCTRLLAEFLPGFVTHARNLPPTCELTLLASLDQRKHLLCLVNAQAELPPIPLHDVELTIHPDFPVTRVIRVSDGKELPVCQAVGGDLILRFDAIQDAEFCLLE